VVVALLVLVVADLVHLELMARVILVALAVLVQLMQELVVQVVMQVMQELLVDLVIMVVVMRVKRVVQQEHLDLQVLLAHKDQLVLKAIRFLETVI
jgi:hypothetical protein